MYKFTEALVSGYISNRHGSAVSEQFEDTFSNGESFEEQNDSALQYIKDDIQDILDSDVLSDSAIDELEDYRTRLSTYLEDYK